MTDAGLIGGSDADRESLLALHAAYLEANASFDWAALDGIWSGSDWATFFNLNGHTYVGRDHWIRLWKFYAGKLETGAWTPYDIGGAIGDGLAAIWCHRKTRLRWLDEGDRPSARARQGLRLALDDGVPEGRRRVAGGPRPFLRGERG